MKRIFLLFFYTPFLFCYNKHCVTNIKKLEAQGQAINVSHCDLRGLGDILSGVDFSGAQLSGALFGPASSNVDSLFSGLVNIVKDGIYQTSNLSNNNFSKASLVSTSFVDANLSDANFSGADIAYADFSGANLTGVNFDKSKNIELARFCNAIMPDGSKNSHGYFKNASGKKCFAHCATA